MIDNVREYITQFNMINPGDEVVIGLSGGADSVCLFMNLLEYSKEVDFTLKAVHINHMIREEASEDASFAKELCQREGIPFYLFEEPVEKIAKEEGISTEEAGRKIRYERFEQVLESKTGKIAVAHNSNDVAETVLFNMFRGTGLEGLSSIEPVNGGIIRPLLGVSRQQIEEYLRQRGQLYVTDRTNLTDMYARNKIRNTILPYAEKEIVKGATSHIAALSEKMRQIRHFIEAETDRCFEEVVKQRQNCIEIDAGKFARLGELMQRQVLLLSLEKLTPHRKDICEKHIEQIISISQKDGEKRVSLPYELEAVKQYEHLLIRKRTPGKVLEKEICITGEGEYQLDENCTVKVRIISCDGAFEVRENPYTKWFDYDKIVNCVKVRNRQPGDYLTVNENLGKKSLKDYMMDEKIPKEERDGIPVIADGNHVMWVVGHRISWEYKVTDSTKRIMEISIMN